MINRYDNFTRLRETILGKVNYSTLSLIKDAKDKELMSDILRETESSLDELEKILRSFDIKIWRPEVYDHNASTVLGSPYTKIDNVYASLTPFDNFLTLADTVVEMSPCDMPSSTFDHVQYQHIWRQKFQEGSRWISMPRPSYNNKMIESNSTMPNFEPYADSPSLLVIGDTVFVAEHFMVNILGMEWLKREFPQFKFKVFTGTHAHLDGYFTVIRPGLALSGISKTNLPEDFQNWDIIEFDKENYHDVTMISDYFQDDDYENTTLAVNMLSIDPENIVMCRHAIDAAPNQIKKLERCGVNVIPVKMDVARWLNQGLSCFTNTIVRDGDLVNYF